MKTTIKRFAAGTFIVLLFLAVYVKVDGAVINLSNSDSIESAIYSEEWIANEMNRNSTIYKLAEVEQEADLKLADWMFNDNTLNFKNSFAEESDAGIKNTDWINKEDFVNTNEVIEPALRVEPWMLKADLKE